MRRRIIIEGVEFEVTGKIVGVVTETKENYNVSLRSQEVKNGKKE